MKIFECQINKIMKINSLFFAETKRTFQFDKML